MQEIKRKEYGLYNCYDENNEQFRVLVKISDDGEIFSFNIEAGEDDKKFRVDMSLDFLGDIIKMLTEEKEIFEFKKKNNASN